jgi:hypothetical protein
VVDDAVVWSVRGVGLFVLARDVKQGVVGFSRGSCVLFTGGLVDEKSRPPMPVVQPVLAWRADMLALIADGDQVQAADALLSLTYYDPEGAWLEGVLTRIVEDPESGQLRALAVTCLGMSLDSTVLWISGSLFLS